MEQLTIQDLLDRIVCADARELDMILAAAAERFRTIWPAWDLLVISSEGRSPEAHILALEKSIQLLSQCIKMTS